MDDEAGDERTPLGGMDPEMRRLLGLLDVPAFARRGHEIEAFESRLFARCRRDRSALLDMVQLRLKQWASATKLGDWRPILAAPIDELWPLSGASPPSWAERSDPIPRRRAIARDLIASVRRFNVRWTKAVGELRLDAYNAMVEQYNRYYILEKEIVLGSSRLAARHFQPRVLLTNETLLARFPLLPEPILAR